MQNTIDEAIAILQAFKEGKTIEFLNAYGEWVIPYDGPPAFNFSSVKYRIKPEPVKVKVALFQGKVTREVRVMEFDHYNYLLSLDSTDFLLVQVSEWIEIEADANRLLNAE